MANLPSSRFGAYVLTETIGQGGMAVVYRAKREGWSGFEKTVVVKAMLPALAAHQEHVDQFIAEAKIQAQLAHPGIVQVHDFGVYAGTPYLVMEHLYGVDLSRLLNALRMREQRMPVSLALVIATQMCHALGYAHSFRDSSSGVRRQVIHSDVSPSNVMVCRDGSVKLLDFGVARVVDACDYDMSQKVQGKYPYMAPEQVNRLPLDRRVDVFAAGIVLHEMLTGRRLFAAENELETLRRVDACEVLPPSTYNPAVPAELDAVVLKALARDSGDRFDSGDEMAMALGRIPRVDDGRRRVAELVAWLFPATFAGAADLPTEPATDNVRVQDVVRALGSPLTHDVEVRDILDEQPAVPREDELAPEISVEASHPMVDAYPLVAEPFPIHTVVDARRPPRSLARALAVMGSVAVVASAAAVVRARNPSAATRGRATTTIARTVPRVDPGAVCSVPTHLVLPPTSRPAVAQAVAPSATAAPATVAPPNAAPLPTTAAAVPTTIALPTAAVPAARDAARAGASPAPALAVGSVAASALPTLAAPSIATSAVTAPTPIATKASRRQKEHKMTAHVPTAKKVMARLKLAKRPLSVARPAAIGEAKRPAVREGALVDPFGKDE
jgi:tRNA A-37 threonylcarbamoyl transferase component Bud32